MGHLIIAHKVKHAVYVMVIFQFLHRVVVVEERSECFSKWEQCVSYEGRLGVILADSELQYGKEGLELEPSQRDLIVYQEQPFSEPTVEDVQLARCDKFIHVGAGIRVR